MKKVLFATSALVASTGFAAADVSISGYAEMGITGGSDVETLFHQDIDVTFSMSGTTDNGLTFGAAVDLDESLNQGGDPLAWAQNGAMTDDNDDGGVAIFISGGFGTLTLGDTDGGYDWGMAEVPAGPGGIADNSSSHSGWNGNGGLDGGNDGQVLRYDHSVGGLGFAVSVEQDDAAGSSDNIVGLGLRYSVGDLAIGMGFQSNDASDVAGVSLSYSMGDLAVGLNYSQVSDATDPDDQTHVGIGMSYTMDAITFGMNYGSYSNVGHDAAADRAGFGMGVSYDLGGGASVIASWETTTDHETASSEDSTWSLGVAMSF